MVLNLLGRSSLALADNFCYVNIGRFLSWLKSVAIKNLLGMELVLFVNREIGTRFLLVDRIGLPLLLLFFPLRRPFSNLVQRGC